MRRGLTHRVAPQSEVGVITCSSNTVLNGEVLARESGR
jgi:hypothetical protein